MPSSLTTRPGEDDRLNAHALPAASLFARADGSAWYCCAWRGPIKDVVRVAILPDEISAYALRHSAITDLIADGVPTLTVAQLPGTTLP